MAEVCVCGGTHVIATITHWKKNKKTSSSIYSGLSWANVSPHWESVHLCLITLKKRELFFPPEYSCTLKKCRIWRFMWPQSPLWLASVGFHCELSLLSSILCSQAWPQWTIIPKVNVRLAHISSVYEFYMLCVFDEVQHCKLIIIKVVQAY